MSILDPHPACAPDGDGLWANTEFDTACRLAWEYSRRLRWNQAANTWVVYKDGRWKKEDKEQSRAYAAFVCTEQMNAHNGEGARNATYIKNVLTQAKSWLAVTPADFDNDPLLLCCADGVVDLKEETCGLWLEHSADFLMTMSTGVELAGHVDEKTGYIRLPEDFGHGFYAWENHLGYMCQNLSEDEGLDFRDFFMRWSGVSLIGSQNQKPQHFVNITGQGRNGKGVAAEARVNALGDYGMIGPIRLVTRKQSDHSTELAGCEGKRLLVVEEVGMVQSAVVKDLTGGGQMTARRMRQDDITFAKSWSLELNSNQPLNLQGESTKAIRRRKIVANLRDEIPGGKHRDGVVEELRAESAIILVWMLWGLNRWYEDGGRSQGLNIPSWMVVEGEEQSEDDDVIASLIAERYERCDESECRVVGSAFVKAVNERRKDSGFLPLTPAAIYAYLRDNKYPVRPGSRNRTMIYGLRPAEFTFGEVLQGVAFEGSSN